jgi:hypothetical protein
MALKISGAKSVPCKCGKVYGRQNGCSIKTRIKEHHQHVHLYHPKNSVVIEHSINLGHQLQLKNAIILANKMRKMDQIFRDVIEIEHHPNNMNREDDFSLSQA